jgi:hypothetical protein
VPRDLFPGGVGVFLFVVGTPSAVIVVGGVLVLLWRVVCIASLVSVRAVPVVLVCSGSGVVWVGVGLVVCVTSCEGHMVDALASRADEGRRSLR